MEVKQLIQLKIKGVSNRQCAQILQINRNTINDYVRCMVDTDVSFSVLLTYTDSQLRDLFPQADTKDRARFKELLAYLPEDHEERLKVGFTFLNKWEDYRSRHREAYGYTQFMSHYHRLYSRPKASMRLEHKVGERLYVDYAGKKIFIVDKDTNVQQKVELFVAILPASQYTYVEAILSQKREDFIGSMNRCLSFFGGCPKAIVSDNFKSAVSKSCKYEPIINKTFKDFGLHYNTVIHPARPYKPQDKALVENAVTLVYQRIVFNIRNMTFFSLEQLNKEIYKWLAIHNQTNFQHRDYSRLELFTKHEKEQLSALPDQPYEIKNFNRAMVQKNGHIYFSPDQHYYSVPHIHIGKRVQIQSTLDTVEVYFESKRIAVHKRYLRPGLYTTRKEHTSREHQYYASWSVDFFVNKARTIGPYCATYVRQLIRSRAFPEQAYKQAQGILALRRQYENKRIENACRLASLVEKYSSKYLIDVLRSGADKRCPELFDMDVNDKAHIPDHDNIRGSNHYS
jgi:transposase